MATRDTYQDLRINSDRDIEISDGGDLRLTVSREENIAQSVAISTSGIVRQLLGGTVNANLLERMVTIITQTLNNDPQISQVVAVNIVEINRANNSIRVQVILTDDDDFFIDLTE